MSGWDKLLDRVRKLSPGHPPITIPIHKPIKKVYIEMVREVVEREETLDAND